MLRLAKWGTKIRFGWASGQVDKKGQANVVRLYEELLEIPPELEPPPSALFFSAVCSKKKCQNTICLEGGRGMVTSCSSSRARLGEQGGAGQLSKKVQQLVKSGHTRLPPMIGTSVEIASRIAAARTSGLASGTSLHKRLGLIDIWLLPVHRGHNLMVESVIQPSPGL